MREVVFPVAGEQTLRDLVKEWKATGPTYRTTLRTVIRNSYIRQRLVKIAARVVEHATRIRVFLPTACPEQVAFAAVAEGLMPAGP